MLILGEKLTLAVKSHMKQFRMYIYACCILERDIVIL